MSIEKQLRRIAGALARERGRMIFGFRDIGPIQHPASSIRAASPPHPTQGDLLAMFQLSITQKVTAAVKFVDAKGNLAKVDGPPEWTTDNSEILALTPSEDGLSCEIQPVGPISVANVTCRADADLGDGMKPIFGTVEIEVTAGEAASVEIALGEPAEA